MARVAITKSVAPGLYPTAGEAITWEAATVDPTPEAPDKNYFVSTGRELVLARNTSEDTDYYVTIESVADEMGREGDITQEDVPFGTMAMWGPFPKNGWAQSNGQIYLEAENLAIEFAVIQLP